ncbi:hypothetical protein [Pedobacter sp. NJ-S-72]
MGGVTGGVTGGTTTGTTGGVGVIGRTSVLPHAADKRKEVKIK